MTTRESSSDALNDQLTDAEVFTAPTSFAQERLWFLDQFEPNSALYNLMFQLRLKETIDIPAMQNSINMLVARHEALRTIFGTEDGRPIQIVLSHLQLAMPIENLSDLPFTERETEFTRRAQAERETAFDLTRGPLMRVRFFKMAENDYRLLILIHHIIFDGWSGGVFIRELVQLYSAATQGQSLTLPELAIQYADFASWQKEWLQGDALAQEMAFWKEHLAGVARVLELPSDRPRPAVQTFHGARIPFELTQQLTDALEQLSRKHNVTIFMTMLAAFEILLGRYTGQQDFVVGTPIAGRTRVELEPIIGFFANTLVLRANLADNPTFTQVVQRVRDVSLNAFVHQEVPFEKLVEELQPERSLSYNPLFQVMFSYLNTPDQEIETTLLEGIDSGIKGIFSKFDMTLTCWKEENLLKGSIEYNSDLFDAATIVRMEGNFLTLLQGIVAHPEQPIALLPLLSAAEREQQLHTWNTTQAEIPNQGVHQVISAQASRTPTAIAVECAGETLTYQALEQRTNQFARHLQRLGVGADQPVGLCVNRSLNMIVAMLGILKAGGAYLPLDPDYPAERLAFMASDAGLTALVVEDTTAALVPSYGGSRINIDTDWATIAQEDYTPTTAPIGPDNLAYIIYTSGSTGVPKGVQIAHGALTNFLTAMRHQPGMTAADVGLALTSISFDIAGLEIYLPLTLGSRVVVVTREVALDAQQLARVIESSGVTVAQATPATWRALIDAGWQGNASLKLLCGGEMLSRDLAQALLARGGSLWNMYGPTETTIWSTLHQVVSVDGNIPIGRPIANTQITLLSPQLQLVPIGVPGELYIGGAGLARGYRGRPDLTAERFIPDPFSDLPNARLYRTGDAARYRADGTIEVLGRLDSQVKVRGFRIELGEIETVLSQHLAINQSVVIVREDVPGDQRITAYMTVVGEAPPVSALRAHLQEHLPAYMIPAAFMEVPAFPLTPNGKIDRRALPAPEGNTTVEQTYIAPRTPAEATLADIWADLLGLERVGVEDNFFELGGHSLLATQMMSRIRDAFQVAVPLRALFESPTVASLAVAIATTQEQSPMQKMSPILRSVRRTRIEQSVEES